MIRNIVFDLGNVLLKDKPQNILNDLKLKEEEKEELRKKFFGDFCSVNMGTETLEEHFNSCGLNFTINEDAKEKILHYYKYRSFNSELVDFMKQLKEAQYNIFILSNNNKETCEYLKSLPDFNCVDGWIISCDYHMVKPYKEIYNKLFEKFNLKPEETYFIDDRKQNIEVGKELGMQGFVLDIKNNGINDLIEKLKNIDIIGEI